MKLYNVTRLHPNGKSYVNWERIVICLHFRKVVEFFLNLKQVMVYIFQSLHTRVPRRVYSERRFISSIRIKNLLRREIFHETRLCLLCSFYHSILTQQILKRDFIKMGDLLLQWNNFLQETALTLCLQCNFI